MAGPLTKKLLIRPGQKMAVLNAPEGYLSSLGDVPVATEKLSGHFQFVQVFVKDSKEFDALAPAAIKAIEPDGLLWVCYPKGSAKVTTDLNRDILWKAMETRGFAGVSLVSIDDTWSAMRFRPAGKVGK